MKSARSIPADPQYGARTVSFKQLAPPLPPHVAVRGLERGLQPARKPGCKPGRRGLLLRAPFLCADLTAEVTEEVRVGA